MMQDKKRLSINIIAQIISFSVQFGINFFLTPFIVSKLGTEAYGFIGLSNTFISYAQVLTVALNSMAGRYIAIEYHKGNLSEANKFFTSVFYANVIMAFVLGLVASCCIAYLELMINIPSRLVLDVKILFLLLVCNFLISIVFSVFNVATFIKNRLDYVAVRSVVGNILRVFILTICFSFFIPTLWYVGLASIICTVYLTLVNFQLKKYLTPELIIRIKDFDSVFVRRVVGSGVWNSFSRLAGILREGFDLLFANLFINAFTMGQFSITKQIPVILSLLIGSIGATFAPSLTKSFAQNDSDSFVKELLFSVKLMGFVSVAPLCFIFTLSDVFYNLWLPGQDWYKLYLLTIIGMFYYPIVFSLEGAQNLWPILDKVKTYSLVSFVFSLCVFTTVFIGIHYVPQDYAVYYLASVSTFYNFVMTFFFIPIYAARCINVSSSFFYPSILKVCFTIIIVVILFVYFKHVVIIDSWFELICAGLFELIIAMCVGFYIILNSEERSAMFAKLRSLVWK